MGKRKRGGPNKKQDEKPSEFEDRNTSKLRINRYEDVADSEDEFLLNRDKILLDEPANKRSKRQQEEEDFLQHSDEEVLGYSESSSLDGDDVDDEDLGAQGGGAGSEDEEGEAGSESEDEIAQWGSAKADYYNTDKITTQEQALAEEQEARRLQQKRLKSLREADFGFDEAEWATTGQDEENEEDAQQSEEAGGVVLEKLPQLQIRADMSDAEKLKLLRRRYPEFESFAKVMVELQPVWDDLKRDFDDYNKSKSSSQADSLPVSVTQFRALSAYLGALTMYFAILTSTARAAADGVTTLPMQPQELREHEIVEYIQQCQDVWEAVKNLDDSNVLPDEADEEASFDGFEGIGDTTLLDNVSSQRINGTSLPSDEQPKNIPGAAERIDPRTAASDARRAARRAQLAASFDMTSAELARAPNLNAQRRSVAVATHDLADEAPLDEREAAEKARRKKSLRFYTSRIAQKANKDSRMADGVGPDDDLPYKERFRDKVERLNREAEARGRKKDIDESDGDDFEDDREEPGMTNAERENDDEYNALIGRAQDKKVAKRQRDEAYRAAKEQGGRPVVQESIVPHTGRREIGWTIEKNKGLTPKRSKLLKNPRVKKRKRYEDKTKKLRTSKPTFKGGPGKGGYGGELTGIKTGLVRGVKL